ncbi:hypothetical protein H6P81_016891 [Aristolochia fimbriata]|uniref:CAAX prenyl protease 2/Lysostaphin resistance protein A-like domain-containing protein n=1 Tax=Aristolochia fimbriata TaxID=158543 RepID=A0AAV7DWT3_ARIFI|nr:hypothetical protein H6P81_016891 [Aristolochia fimbriata]
MSVAPRLYLLPCTANNGGGIGKVAFPSRTLSIVFSSRPPLKASSARNGGASKRSQGFSVLSSDTLWDKGSLWSTTGAYFFGLHIPLSFGGLSVVSQILHQTTLDPQTQAVSLVIIQTLELLGALALLGYSAKHPSKLPSLFSGQEAPKGRNWIVASAVGFGFLMLLVFLASFLADRLIGPKDVNNPVLKEILSSGTIARSSCFLVYCFITPLMEEIVYRGFLLSSLISSNFQWQHAVIISSCIFSAAHLSVENSIQLFLIGCVLGSTCCWSGKLSSSFVVHSLYNAATLIYTILS